MKKTLLINGESLGKGDEKLGRDLMGSFLRKLWSNKDRPDSIVLYNSGVRLIAQGSPVLDALNGLFKAGVDIMACGTCIGFYDLKDRVAVGRVSNMEEIAGLLVKSDRVITV